MRTLAVVAAFAAMLPGTATGAPRELLPNLVALPPASVYVGGPMSTFVSSGDEVVYGCHPSEVLHDTPTPARCLRFQTIAANLGAGPLELHYRADEIATTRGVRQRVYASDGTFTDRKAGSYVVDYTHTHFHYEDFAVAALWRSDVRGRRLGATPVRKGTKAGFCLQDVYRYRSNPAAQAYTGPASCYPARADTGGLAQVNGVSAGWVDVYDMAVPHQYIEISGVTDGYYLLQVTLDPARRLREATRADNTTWLRLRLCGDRADVVGKTSSCGAPGAASPIVFPGHTTHRADRLAYCASLSAGARRAGR